MKGETNLNQPILSDDPERQLVYTECVHWIQSHLSPTKAKILDSSSYGLKHEFADAGGDLPQPGRYLTNGEFKACMLQAGFPPVNPAERNWRYRAKRRKVMNLMR